MTIILTRMMELVKSMQEELFFVQNNFNQVHPEAYHYISKKSFNQKINKLN